MSKGKHIHRTRTELNLCKSIINNIKGDLAEEQMIASWSHFLNHYCKCVKTMADHGKNVGHDSWSHKLINEQKEDEILQYLFQSRNSDEHRVDFIAERVRGEVHIGSAIAIEEGCEDIFIGDVTEVNNAGQIKSYQPGSISFVDGRFRGSLSPGTPVHFKPAYLKPVAVSNRGVQYSVPEVSISDDKIAAYFMDHAVEWLETKLHELYKLN